MNQFKSISTVIAVATVLALCGCTSDQGDRSNDKVIAMVELDPASGSNVHGTVRFIQEGHGILVKAHITGLTPGKHGFHIHEKGDCSAPDASSAGGHFNPTGMPHGGPMSDMHHMGDFGNLDADESGVAHYEQMVHGLSFVGTNSIIGKAIIVHGKADDLMTQPTGNSGARVACGVIEAK